MQRSVYLYDEETIYVSTKVSADLGPSLCQVESDKSTIASVYSLHECSQAHRRYQSIAKNCQWSCCVVVPDLDATCAAVMSRLAEYVCARLGMAVHSQDSKDGDDGGTVTRRVPELISTDH